MKNQQIRMALVLGFVCALAGAFVNCKDEKKASKFVGRWQTIGGTFDKLTTDQLNGFYLDMKEDGSLQSNINVPVSDETGTYQLKGNTIVQDIPSQKLRFDVQSVTDTLLQLSTELQGHDLIFVLRKSDGTTPNVENK